MPTTHVIKLISDEANAPEQYWSGDSAVSDPSQAKMFPTVDSARLEARLITRNTVYRQAQVMEASYSIILSQVEPKTTVAAPVPTPLLARPTLEAPAPATTTAAPTPATPSP